MSKSRSKSRSEVEFLRGEVRRLKSELKYYKKRQHFFEDQREYVIEEEINNRCEVCKKGKLIEHDFVHATLIKCTNCDYEKKKSKK